MRINKKVMEEILMAFVCSIILSIEITNFTLKVLGDNINEII